jgi:hypothetical protein
MIMEIITVSLLQGGLLMTFDGIVDCNQPEGHIHMFSFRQCCQRFSDYVQLTQYSYKILN